jgi:excisionase family DNA binding protein
MSRQALNRGEGRTDHQGESPTPNRIGPRRSGEEGEEEMSRTGKLVVILQDQVEDLTVAIQSLERHLPATLVDIRGAANYLDVSIRTVRRMVVRREIPYRRVGKVLRFDLTDLRPPRAGLG